MRFSELLNSAEWRRTLTGMEYRTFKLLVPVMTTVAVIALLAALFVYGATMGPWCMKLYNSSPLLLGGIGYFVARRRFVEWLAKTHFNG